MTAMTDGELQAAMIQSRAALRALVDEKEQREANQAHARKPIRRFLQVDGWQDCEPGLSEHDRHVYACHPDEDGEVTMAGVRREHRNTDFPVRVQIHEGSDKAQVLRLLGKITRFLKRDFDELWDLDGPHDAHGLGLPSSDFDDDADIAFSREPSQRRQ